MIEHDPNTVKRIMDDLLTRENISITMLAAELDVSMATIHNYRKQNYLPRLVIRYLYVMERISKWEYDELLPLSVKKRKKAKGEYDVS